MQFCILAVCRCTKFYCQIVQTERFVSNYFIQNILNILHAGVLVFQFSKFHFFIGRKGQEGQRASLCQISRRSVKPLLRYGDIPIFQNGSRSHLGFLNLKILTVGRVKSFKLRDRVKFSGDRSNRF